MLLLIAVSQMTAALNNPSEAKGTANKRSLLPYFKKVAASDRHKANIKSEIQQERQRLQKIQSFLAKIIESITPKLSLPEDSMMVGGKQQYWKPVFK